MRVRTRPGKRPALSSGVRRVTREPGNRLSFFEWVGLFPRSREIHLGQGVSLGRGTFPLARRHHQIAGGQTVLVAVLENGWGEDELAAKLERVLDMNGWRNGLESQLVGILAEAIQAVNGK